MGPTNVETVLVIIVSNTTENPTEGRVFNNYSPIIKNLTGDQSSVRVFRPDHGVIKRINCVTGRERGVQEDSIDFI